MKMKIRTNGPKVMVMLLAFLIFLTMQKLVAQVCADPENVIHGLTGNGEIRPITIATGNVGAPITPSPYAGNAPDYSNALGYNPSSARFYYFKRNVFNTPQEFVTLNSLTGIVTMLANSPAASIVNLGAVASHGLGYYCIDALGRLYYYRIGVNSWATVCTNVRDQYGTPLATIINKGASIGPLSRIYGDIAFDAGGNMWILISGPGDFGLYKIPANVPTSSTASLTIQQILPPTTPSPDGQTIGGIAFNNMGQLLFATNAGDNKLYRMGNDYSITYLSTMTVDGIGTDLVSCAVPLYALSSSINDFSAARQQNDVVMSWKAPSDKNNSGFAVEHSADGKNWERVGFVVEKQPGTGVHAYNYVHKGLVSGKHHYRLAKIDVTRKTNYSEEKLVTLDNAVKISVWPNPVQDKLMVSIPAEKSLNASISIFDKTGKQLSSTLLERAKANINVHSLNPGTYFIKVILSDGEVINHRFVKSSL